MIPTISVYKRTEPAVTLCYFYLPFVGSFASYQQKLSLEENIKFTDQSVFSKLQNHKSLSIILLKTKNYNNKKDPTSSAGPPHTYVHT